MRKVATFLLACWVLFVFVAIGVAGVDRSDRSDDAYQRMRLKWYGETISVPITSTNAAAAAGVKILDGGFPEGHIVIHGAVAKDVTFTVTATNGVDGTDNGDFAIGTAVGAGTAMTTTEVNIIPSTAQDDMTNVTDGVIADDAIIDGSAAAIDIFVNLMIDADVANAVHTNAVTTSGEVIILWSLISDD